MTDEISPTVFSGSGLDPIRFPDSSSPSLQSQSFEDACAIASETGQPIILRENVTVSKTIVLKKRQHLVIRTETATATNTGSDGSSNNLSTRIPKQQKSIVGNAHSLFLLNNQSQLTLENVELNHTLESDDHRQIGAAVNLRYKGKLEMKNSSITSTAGFCCWAVQKTQVHLVDCHLRAPTRSAVVCFGQAKCILQHCHMQDAGVHAICARGACQLTLTACKITKSAARAIYAYANASVAMTSCHVSHTIHPGKAAIEISAAGCSASNPSRNQQGSASSGGGSSLSIQDCTIIDNGGAGICLQGPVSFTETGDRNILERNEGGNIVHKPLVDGDEEEAEDTKKQVQRDGTNHHGVRRDSPNTSFRQGDWWCPKCPQYVLLDRQNNCPKCGSWKSTGRHLTVQEIHRCNQGLPVNPVGSTLTTTISSSTSTPVIWYFDADDKGWIQYDKESRQQLEEAYQNYLSQNSPNDASCPMPANDCATSPLVQISNGKYQVNVATMEQINVQSHFMRLVRRRQQQKNGGQEHVAD